MAKLTIKIAVGIKSFYGTWCIIPVDFSMDDQGYPILTNSIVWSSGERAEFYKETGSGRMLYQQVQR